MTCEIRIAASVKGKVYKMVVRPVMMYGSEMVAVTKRQEVELKMLRFLFVLIRMNMIREEYISGTAQFKLRKKVIILAAMAKSTIFTYTEIYILCEKYSSTYSVNQFPIPDILVEWLCLPKHTNEHS